MASSWLPPLRLALAALFAPPAGPRPARRISGIDLGVCPGCRGIRLAGSPRCSHCGSLAKVTADA